MKAKLPAKPTTDEAGALAKAKAKLAVHGLALTLDKSEAQSSDPLSIEFASAQRKASRAKIQQKKKPGNFCKHPPKQGHAKQEWPSTREKKLAARLTPNHLSTVIAAAQFEAS